MSIRYTTEVADFKPNPRLHTPATISNGIVFVSGQTPVDGEGKQVAGGIKECTQQCIDNVEKILKASGSSLKSALKVTVFLKTMDDYEAMNEVYTKAFGSPKPARTCIQAGKLPRDVIVEIECIAALEAVPAQL